MTKTVLLILVITLIILILVILVLRAPQKKGATSVLRIGEQEYEVEIADTLVSQARGLSGRERLAPGAGMLFVFNGSSRHSFWMRGMKFPLDFIWINNNRVIGITENAPVGSMEVYQPPESADMVLEVVSGTVAKDGIKIGDEVSLKE